MSASKDESKPYIVLISEAEHFYSRYLKTENFDLLIESAKNLVCAFELYVEFKTKSLGFSFNDDVGLNIQRITSKQPNLLAVLWELFARIYQARSLIIRNFSIEEKKDSDNIKRSLDLFQQLFKIDSQNNNL